jgi:hypothetical protein
MATTPPMKKPTAIELWNFLMIMVPPILNASNINADHIEVKASLNPRVDMTAHDISARTPVKLKIEYLEDGGGTVM